MAESSVELAPCEKVVEVVAFESQDPAFAAWMRLTASLADARGGSEITMLSADIPTGIRPEDNGPGAEESLKKPAALSE